jgi:NitT/TauT family transport system ATP-binding protein
MASDAVITFENVGVAFGDEQIYDRLSFDVRPGEFVCILGPSGCGKSTLLRMIGGLLAASTGRVTVDGRAPRDAWSEIAFVFQSPRLAPWRTALDNVLLGMELRFGAGDKERRRARSSELLSLVGLAGDAHKYPSMLSGGERQRVAIARARLRQPRLLLLDEATSQLDAVNEAALRATIADVAEQTTVLVIAHRLSTVTMADRIIVLDAGRVRAIGTHAELVAGDALYAELATTQFLATAG